MILVGQAWASRKAMRRLVRMLILVAEHHFFMRRRHVGDYRRCIGFRPILSIRAKLRSYGDADLSTGGSILKLTVCSSDSNILLRFKIRGAESRGNLRKTASKSER